MEFFREFRLACSAKDLQRLIRLEEIEQFSTQLFPLEKPLESTVYIGSIWGEFSLLSTQINGGLRFALLECPNALCWTITTGQPPVPEHTILHLTINRIKKDQEFIDEIEDFLDDHQKMLIQNFGSI